MTYRKLLAAILLCLCCNRYAMAAELEARTYGIRLSDYDRRRIEWKGLLSGFGVTWPEGSQVLELSSGVEVTVVNTIDNHRVIGAVLQVVLAPPPRVEVEVMFLEFNREDIARILKFEPGATVDTDRIFGLWRQGKATVVCAPRAVTVSGCETTVKSVEEYIYPTEFGFRLATNAVAGVGGLRSMEFVPAGFETREVGHILTVLPEVDLASDRVFLCMAPDVTFLPEWVDYGDSCVRPDGRSRQFRMEQPFFSYRSVYTEITTKSGQSRVIGGGTVSKDGKRFTYVVATAWIRDMPRQSSMDTIDLGEMSLRGFHVSPSQEDAAHDRMKRVEEDGTQAPYEYSWRSLLSTMGITWPQGSAVRKLSGAQRLVVKNTRENLADVAAALDDLTRSRPDVLVDVELLYAECDTDLVETELRESGERAMDANLVLQLCREGKCDIVAAPKAVTQVGQEATVKGVVEYIYPTEFIERAICTDPATGITACVAEPGGFETREIGDIMSVIPEIESTPTGRAIWLTLAPEIVAEPTWKEYGAIAKTPDGKEHATNIKQPFFKTFSVNTQVRIREGETVLIGSAESHRPGRRIFLLATAKIIDVE